MVWNKLYSPNVPDPLPISMKWLLPKNVYVFQQLLKIDSNIEI